MEVKMGASSRPVAKVVQPTSSEATLQETTIQEPIIPSSQSESTVDDLLSHTAVDEEERQLQSLLKEEVTQLRKRKLKAMKELAQQGKDPALYTWEDIAAPALKRQATSEVVETLMSFSTRLKSIFHLNPRKYPDDKRKVWYASSGLTGTARQRWDVEQANVEDIDITFSEFMDWCASCVGDGRTRLAAAFSKLERLKQGNTEKLIPFMDRFNTIFTEASFTLPEHVKIEWFLAKCTPETRKNLITQGDAATWMELRNKGIKAEAWNQDDVKEPKLGYHYRGSGAPQNSNRPEDPGQPNKAATSSQQDTKDEEKSRRTLPVCWKCGGAHIRPYCKAPDCTQCNSSKHTTERHGNPVNQATGSNAHPVAYSRQT